MYVSAFSPRSGNWRAYIERLEDYFVANSIKSAQKKRAILLSVCGPKTYELIRDLVLPAKPSDKTFTQIVELVTKHYSPKPSVEMQRFKINCHTQGKDDLIACFVA